MASPARTGQIAGLLVTALVLTAGPSFAAPDSEPTAAGETRLLLRNELMEVIEFRLAPGGTLEKGDIRNRVVYALSDHSVRLERQRGEPVERHLARGEVYWARTGNMRVRNTGNSEARYIEFRSLLTPFDPDPAGPSGYEMSVAAHISASAPETARTLFDNDHFRVTEYAIPEGEILPSHMTGNKVVLALGGLSIRYDGDGSSVKTMTRMQMAWKAGGKYALENVGPGNADFLTVEIKPPQRYTDFEP